MKKQNQASLLKIGELAAQSGLTVRALHHYDSIGLLCPSARTDAGYRLYNRADIARLHQIQALRGFGMTLADIERFLASPDASLSAVVDQQIDALARQIERAAELRRRLLGLRQQMQAGETPDLAGWLTTLELMTMYDNYFSKEELASLPFFNGNQKIIAEWDALIAQVKALMAAGTSPSTQQAGKLAFHWMTLLERDTQGHAGLAARLSAMQASEPGLREINGITAETEAYVREAMACARLALFRKYLSPAEFDFMNAHYRTRSAEWPPLIADLRAAHDAKLAPTDPAVRALALRWAELWCSFAGTDPATHAKIRQAYQQEPQLMVGSFITDAMQQFIGQALQALQAVNLTLPE